MEVIGMTKVLVKIPQIKWRTEKIETPPGRTEVVKEALRAQQERMNDRLARRNEEVVRQLEEASKPSKGGRRGLVGKVGLLGIGAAIGAGVGVLAAPKPGKETRSEVTQTTTKLARNVTERAKAARSKGNDEGQGEAGQTDTGPETITSRVQARLGQDEVLGPLPRLSVSTEPGGIVYLRGAAPTDVVRDRAERIARGVEGVTLVVNELTITGPAASLQ
jgi:osmotically-inducible protein OsmY